MCSKLKLLLLLFFLFPRSISVISNLNLLPEFCVLRCNGFIHLVSIYFSTRSLLSSHGYLITQLAQWILYMKKQKFITLISRGKKWYAVFKQTLKSFHVRREYMDIKINIENKQYIFIYIYIYKFYISDLFLWLYYVFDSRSLNKSLIGWNPKRGRKRPNWLLC